MSQAILSLSLVGICTALCEMLLPKGQGEGTKGALRLLLSLAVLLILLRPFIGFLQSEATLDLGAVIEATAADAKAYETIFESTVARQGEADFKKRLYDLLEAEFGITSQQAEIALSFDKNGEPVLLKIYLAGTVQQDPHALAVMLQARLGMETEVW